MAAITVQAGEHARRQCPVWVPVDTSVLPGGDVGLRGAGGEILPAQVLSGDVPSLCFIVPNLLKGQSATYELIAHSADTPGVALSDVPGERIDVSVNEALFTSYHYDDKWARPFLLPIVGPYGDPITRHFPVEEVDGEAQDHPHHKSCWVAWGEVNGSDHWSEVEDRFARQVHQEFEAVSSGPVFGRIAATNHWLDLEGKTILEEKRTLTFYNVPAAERLVDLRVVFTATKGPVEFGDTKEGGICSIRVATSMDAKKDGTIVNSYGGTNEAETWGKRASWCDYYGPVNDKTVGISIFDTPGNFRYPTYWHVRNYGLMTANPFGLSYFLGDKEQDGSHTIAAGEVFPFVYRLYFHAGTTEEADVAGKFLDHVAAPKVSVE